MKKKIVLWGENENDKKVLIAIELLASESKVDIYTFPEEVATEELYSNLMDNWRADKEISFPEGHQVLSRPLSVTEELLPETLKVERTDLIARAKTEWHFAILSSKLYEMYKSELEEFKDQFSKLVNYDQGLWDDLKTFWGKVQNQARDKNLFWDHVNELKNDTNKLFEQLKEKRSVLNDEFKKSSQEVLKTFTVKMEEIEGKLEKGLGLKPLFEELKTLQKDLWNEKMTHGDRKMVWGRIDKAFKVIKEKRFGDKPQNNHSALGRLESRYKGLLNALKKMEQSIKRDKEDMAFQTKRVEKTDGQLEMQIRQAKMKMIEERIRSKEEKLKEIVETQKSLEQKIQKEKSKAEAIAKKTAEKKVIAKAKTEIKAKIASDIKKTSAELEANADKLKKAAEAIKSSKKTDNAGKGTEAKVIAAAIASEDKPSEAKKDAKVKDAVDKSNESKIEQTQTVASKDVDVELEEIKKPEVKKADDSLDDKKDEIKQEPAGEEGLFSAITTTISESVTDMIDTVKAVAEVVEDKVEEKMDDVKEKIQEHKNQDAEEGSKGITGMLSDAISETVEKTKEMIDQVEDKVEDIMDKAKSSSETSDNNEKGISGTMSKIAGVAGAVTIGLSDKLDDVVEKAKELSDKIEDKVNANSEEEE